jgi:Domain of unknown function (DUF6980)
VTGEPVAEVCCPMMERQLSQRCDIHQSPWDCPDFVVVRLCDGTYGLPIRTGANGSASSSLALWHCPWCGSPLPGHQVHPVPDDGTASGKALTKGEVEARQEAWNAGAGGATEFHEYLGWSWEEYATWVETGELPSFGRTGS